MTNRPKAIGTQAEMGVVRYLESLFDGITGIYRPALQGTLDLGDVHYVTRAGSKVVISVKGGHMAEKATPETVAGWLGEVEHQRVRAKGDFAYVVTKRLGVGNHRAGLWRAHVLLGNLVWTTDLASMVRSIG